MRPPVLHNLTPGLNSRDHPSRAPLFRADRSGTPATSRAPEIDGADGEDLKPPGSSASGSHRLTWSPATS